MALQLPNLGSRPRVRKVLSYLGFAVLGLVTFVFAFQMTFPFDRVKDKVVDQLTEKYEVSIGGVERGFIPGRVYFNAVSLRTRPAKADDVATTFYIEQLEVDLGLLPLIHGTIVVKLDAKIGPGHLKGDIALSKDATTIELAGTDLPSASLPMREVLGLPMSGKLRFTFNLELPNEKAKTTGKVGPNWLKAEGNAELACPSGCTVGDGKTKLKFNVANKSQQAFAENGIDFGKVNIDSLLATIELKEGKLDITKFEAKSGDGELHVDFGLTLNQDLAQSQVAGCLRYNGSSALLKREPKTHAAISTTGAPLGPDNLFHIKLDGTLKQMRRLGIICGATAAGMKPPEGQGGTTARPNLTITPEPPAKPAGSGNSITIPQPSQVAQPPPQPATVPQNGGNAAPHVPPSGPTGESPPPNTAPPIPTTPPSPAPVTIPTPNGAAEPSPGALQ